MRCRRAAAGLCAVVVLVAACSGPGLAEQLSDAGSLPPGLGPDADAAAVVQTFVEDPGTAVEFLGAGEVEALADRWAAVFADADPATAATLAADVLAARDVDPGRVLVGIGRGLAAHGEADTTLAVVAGLARSLPPIAAPDETGFTDPAVPTFATDVVEGLAFDESAAVVRLALAGVLGDAESWRIGLDDPRDSGRPRGHDVAAAAVASVLTPFAQALAQRDGSRAALDVLGSAVAEPIALADLAVDLTGAPMAPVEATVDRATRAVVPPTPDDVPTTSTDLDVYVGLADAVVGVLLADPDAELVRAGQAEVVDEVIEEQRVDQRSDDPSVTVRLSGDRTGLIDEDVYASLALGFRPMVIRAVSTE